MKQNILKVLFLFAFIYASLAGAQTSNGTIIGTVTDSTGGVVVGAKITATSMETSASRSTTSDSQGGYRLESVMPGTYDISTSAPGYQTAVQKSLTVPGTTIVTANIALKVGQATEIVEVSANNAAVNTDNGQLSDVISPVEIQNLPTASLSPYELALTLPGVSPSTQGGMSNGVNFEVGGGRSRANNFLIEGQDNNDAGIGGQGLQPENTPAYQETSVLTNSYTAEFGHGGGSISNLILKSGTNQFHGSVYERLQNNSLDAVDKSDHFNNVTQVTKYRENMPGFAIGGPIFHNKLFAFGSYQWDNYRSSANLAVLSIPTTNGLATLSALPSDPRLTNLMTAWGSLVGTINPNNKLPGIALGPDQTTGVDRGTVEMGTVQRNLGADSNSPELDLTGDYVMSTKDTLRLHMIRTSFLAPFDVFNFTGQLPGFDSNQNGVAYNSGIVETHVFSPTLTNEARLSYGRIGFSFGLPASTVANPLYDQPAVSVSNLTGYGIPGSIPQGRFHDTYQLQDTLSWAHKKHFFKIGADVANIRVRDGIPFNFYGSISYSDDAKATPVPAAGKSVTYTGLADLIDDFGGPSSDDVAQNFGSPTARPTFYYQNYFAEDTYRATPNLSIDFGLRYEYNGSPFNTPETPYPGIDESQIGCYPTAVDNCNSKEESTFKNWGPRAGLAYSPTFLGAHKSVFRAGFGVFYDVIFTNIIDNIQATAPAAASPVIYSSTTANANRGVANWYEQFANLNPTALPGNTSEPIVNKLLRPMTMQWNLALEQELPWASSLQVSYVGERGEHLFANTELNPYLNDAFGDPTRVNPTRGNVVVRDNSADSEYAALWTQFEHKFNHNFLFRAAYTFGKDLDDGSEIFTFNNQSSYQFSRYPTPRGTTDWGPSGYDHRQRLVLSYVWQPPIWHTEGAMKAVGNLVNRWTIAGVTQFQSGTPENVEDGYDTDGDGIGNDRPVLGNPKAPLATYAFDDSWFYGVSDGGLCSGPAGWYSPLPCQPVTASQVHWIIPAYGTHPLVPVGRNTLTSPGYQQWDMDVARQFKIHDNITFALRGEFFNIFNHGEAGVENTSLITGIVSDQFFSNGTNNFANPAPTVSGHRHVRVVASFSF
jgi:hypothetical protein